MRRTVEAYLLRGVRLVISRGVSETDLLLEIYASATVEAWIATLLLVCLVAEGVAVCLSCPEHANDSLSRLSSVLP